MRTFSRFPFIHDGDNSCAVATTSFSEAPPDASVAALTAPSTIGALQTTIFWERGSPIISTAISLLVSAPPRSTRIATPASDQALSLAPMIASTLVPSPPWPFPPHHARGTSSPTIWRTMSAVPSATSGECDTVTSPTLRIKNPRSLQRLRAPAVRSSALRRPYARSSGLPGRRRAHAGPSSARLHLLPCRLHRRSRQPSCPAPAPHTPVAAHRAWFFVRAAICRGPKPLRSPFRAPPSARRGPAPTAIPCRAP